MADYAKLLYERHGTSAIGFDQPELSDVTIKFSDRSVHAHKITLSQGSPYFRKMFSRFQESTQREVTLYDDHPDAVMAVLLALDKLALVRLYVAADKYELDKLRVRVLARLSSVWWTKRDSDLPLGDPDLYEMLRLGIANTPESDKGLRQLIIRWCTSELKTLRTLPAFAKLLAQVPELCVALVMHTAEYVGTGTVSINKCVDCHAAVTQDTIDQYGDAWRCKCGKAMEAFGGNRFTTCYEKACVLAHCGPA